MRAFGWARTVYLAKVRARSITSLTYLLKLQRDQARLETYDTTASIAERFGGAFGVGIQYAKAMFGRKAG